MYNGANSISYPLTSTGLIFEQHVTSTPNSTHLEIISTYQSLTRRARHRKNLLQQVTKQWRKEYLTSLHEQSNVVNKRNGTQEILVGDIMLLKNDSTTRTYWKYARVEELIPGVDGKVQAPIVKVGNNNKRLTYLRRVVQHLIPIEVKTSVVSKDRQLVTNHVSNLVVRPRCTAAVVGEISCRELNIVGFIMNI